MKNKTKGINTILAMSMLYCSVDLGYAQTGIGTKDPKGALHVDGAKDNAPTPTAAQLANDVIVNATTGFVGVGVLSPAVPLDMRSSGTDNAIGLDTTTMTAAAAGAGAVRYYENAILPLDPKIEVSDGVVWSRIYIPPVKAVVVARKITSLNIGTSATTITDWNEVRDLSSSFNPTTGVFTAPRSGTYTFLLTFNFVYAQFVDGARVESQFYRTSGTPAVIAAVYKTFGHSMDGDVEDGPSGFRNKNSQAGGSSTVTLTLAKDDTVVPRLLHNLTTGNIALRVTSNASDPSNPDDGFNNLTIIEH